MAVFGSSALYQGYNAGTSNRGRTGAPWMHFSDRRIAAGDSGYGVFTQIDFSNSDTIAAEMSNGWTVIAVGASVVSNRALLHVGTILDDDTVVLSGDGLAANADFVFSSTDPKMLCFEAGLKKVAIDEATTDNSNFVGLVIGGLTTTNDILAAGGAVAAVDHIGFHHATNGSGVVDVVWQANGQAAQSEPAVATLTVGGNDKLGFQYNPNFPSEERIRFFVNGVVVHTLAQSDIDAVTFPDDIQMCACAAVSTGGTSSPGNDSIDFVAAGQEL